MALSDAIADIASKAGALAGVKTAPVSPPESINQYPFAVTYAARSADTIRFESQGFGHYFHIIICEFQVARNISNTTIDLALTYIELLPSSIMADQKLSNTVEAVRGIDYNFGRLEWNGVQSTGVQFEIDVKIKLE